MSVSTQPYKGARDFYPEDKRLQKWMFTKWAQVFELYGYEEYDAPIIEDTALYLLKGSDEIISEQAYSFIDRGGRNVTIRTEMTPSVSRMVASKRHELTYPLRWYSIPELWRYERPQRGRSRQFWQANVDLFGVEGLEADHEIISIADSVMQTFGAKRSKYQIKVNSRTFIDHLLGDYIGLDEVESATVRRLIDRMHKMDFAAFEAAITAAISPSKREAGADEKLMRLLTVQALIDLPEDLKQHPTLKNLIKLEAMLLSSGITNAVFDITLMRGFDYYTDIVFEVFDMHPDNNRSMFGGGRYDGLIAQFGAEPVSAVGFGMGDLTFLNFLETHELMPVLPAETELYVVLIGDTYSQAQELLLELRQEGVRVAVDMSGRKIDKQIKTAERKGIEHVLFVGEQELKDKSYALKNLTTGQEQKLSVARLVTSIKDIRKK